MGYILLAPKQLMKGLMLPPNIVYILDDQHRYGVLGVDGNSIIQTPHLDRLAEQGMVFDQSFSSCPICAPYRAQLFTGRYSHCNGVLDNEYKMHCDQVTLAQALKSGGYHTGTGWLRSAKDSHASRDVCTGTIPSSCLSLSVLTVQGYRIKSRPTAGDSFCIRSLQVNPVIG